MPLCPDDCLGPYRIIGFLGAGGMGEVYRAHDPRLGRDVALKILKDRKPGFDKEARAAAALCHPNIVTIYDVGPDYVVMELIEGESLRQRLSHGALSFREVVETGAQIAEGLAAAHAARIIHRDLKPENIVITRDGHAKILDFGLAKRTDMLDSDTRETLTQPGGIKGTTAYTVEARGILAEMHQTFDRDYAEPYAMAAVYAALGEADQAFHWLDRACQDRTSLFSLWVNSDPRFDSVSSDARMKVLLDKVAARLTASSTPRSS